MPESESKRSPVVKSGISLEAGINNKIFLEKLLPELRKKYEMFFEKSKGLEQEALELNEETLKHVTVDFALKYIPMDITPTMRYAHKNCKKIMREFAKDWLKDKKLNRGYVFTVYGYPFEGHSEGFFSIRVLLELDSKKIYLNRKKFDIPAQVWNGVKISQGFRIDKGKYIEYSARVSENLWDQRPYDGRLVIPPYSDYQRILGAEDKQLYVISGRNI